MSGILYLVATPIGNLEDITFRALKTLKEVQLIAAEDTRHTGLLLKHFQINTPLSSFYSYNQKEKAPELIDKILSGVNVALVSDAGTPGISDPAVSLVAKAVKAGIKVVPIPGATALISALIASGLDTSQFVFTGFLPVKPGRRAKAIEQLTRETRTIVIYESPHRISRTLQELADVFKSRQSAVCREITKMFEEFERGSLSELADRYQRKTPKGEFVIVIAGNISADKRRKSEEE
jgi:16S rRNA (cytidine1402-2'-O)-methyltransferase